MLRYNPILVIDKCKLASIGASKLNKLLISNWSKGLAVFATHIVRSTVADNVSVVSIQEGITASISNGLFAQWIDSSTLGDSALGEIVPYKVLLKIFIEYCELKDPSIVNTPLIVNNNRIKHVHLESGLVDGKTKWEGCACKFVLVKIFIVVISI